MKRHTITELKLIAGLNGEGDNKEAYFEDAEYGKYDFIVTEVSTCGDKTFEFNFKTPSEEHIGRLEFDIDQAYFLHSWLTALLNEKR